MTGKNIWRLCKVYGQMIGYPELEQLHCPLEERGASRRSPVLLRLLPQRTLDETHRRSHRIPGRPVSTEPCFGTSGIDPGTSSLTSARSLRAHRPSSRPRIRVTKRSPDVSLATSVLIRSRTSAARPPFSAAFTVPVYAAHTSPPVIS